MPTNDELLKLRELILYISKYCEKKIFFGAIHLNKILFFSDFYHFKFTGKSITDVLYQKIRKGPAPRHLIQARETLVSQGRLKIELNPIGIRTQERPIALDAPKQDLFTKDQLDFVNSIADWACQMPTDPLSDYSHKLYWELAEYKETIPYTAIHTTGVNPITASSKTWAKEIAVKTDFID